MTFSKERVADAVKYWKCLPWNQRTRRELEIAMKNHGLVDIDARAYARDELVALDDLLPIRQNLTEYWVERDHWLLDLGLSASERARLYVRAVDILIETHRASTSFLQRELKVSYNMAEAFMQKAEDEGVVTKPNHLGARSVAACAAAIALSDDTDEHSTLLSMAESVTTGSGEISK